jgi:hypothetical protein
MPRIADITNKRFGRLVACWPSGIRHSGSIRSVTQVKKHRAYTWLMRNHSVFWLCVCDCGTLKQIPRGSLTSGGSRSCGCLRRQLHLRRSFRHGGSKEGARWPEYLIFRGAMARCRNKKNSHFKHYGGRGIKFLFRDFNQFINEVGMRPSPKHSIDRINNDGNYEPGNVRWATAKEQIDNRRVKYLKDFSTEQLLAELARRQS